MVALGAAIFFRFPLCSTPSSVPYVMLGSPVQATPCPHSHATPSLPSCAYICIFVHVHAFGCVRAGLSCGCVHCSISPMYPTPGGGVSGDASASGTSFGFDNLVSPGKSLPHRRQSITQLSPKVREVELVLCIVHVACSMDVAIL